jgi:hypothetical protein
MKSCLIKQGGGEMGKVQYETPEIVKKECLSDITEAPAAVVSGLDFLDANQKF